MLRIYIPTIGREDQITLRCLPKALQKNAVLVVPPQELKDWEAKGVPAIAHPKTCRTIGPVRQWIIDQHDDGKFGPFLIMLDDDLRFSVRREDDPTKFGVPTDKDVIEGFKQVERALKKYPHAALRHREMANEADPVEYCTRALRALAYNVRVMRKLKIRFDRTIVMEDFDVTLQLLKLGHPNVILSTLIQNQIGSGAKGGCSTYRTMEKQAEGAKALAALHAPFVKVVEKETKGAWGGGKRLDVQVAWKQAFKSSGKALPTEATI